MLNLVGMLCSLVACLPNYGNAPADHKPKIGGLPVGVERRIDKVNRKHEDKTKDKRHYTRPPAKPMRAVLVNTQETIGINERQVEFGTGEVTKDFLPKDEIIDNTVKNEERQMKNEERQINNNNSINDSDNENGYKQIKKNNDKNCKQQGQKTKKFCADARYKILKHKLDDRFEKMFELKEELDKMSFDQSQKWEEYWALKRHYDKQLNMIIADWVMASAMQGH